METIFYIKKGESKMERLFSKMAKSVVLTLCVVLGGGSAFAQTLLVDGASSSSVCPGDPIVLTTSEFPENTISADLYSSTDGGSNWMAVASSADPSRSYTFVMDMGSKAVSFKVRSRTRGSESPVETNEVKVSVETDCARGCHQSSTGEYINGTDFDPVNPNYSAKDDHVISESVDTNKIESHFHEQNITLSINSDCGSQVSNDFGQYFGDLKPKTDKSNYSNYYWFSRSNMGNCSPYSFNFLMIDRNGKGVWDEKYYRMTMRTFITLNEECQLNNCSQAKLKLECKQGSNDNFDSNADHADILVYDDATDELLGKKTVTHSFGDVFLNDLFCKQEYRGKLLRMEVNFYGRFKLRNKNNGTIFNMTPLFEQFGCVQMALDYISADIMSVCLDRGAACVGDRVAVNAAGFPYDADYEWEVENEHGGWDKLKVDGFDVSDLNYQTVNIPVKEVGKRRYRVYDKKTLEQNLSEYLYFDITGKDCEPVQPKDISGPEKVCAPVVDTMFTVSPVDANPNVRYSWKLTDSKGNDITSTSLKYSLDGKTDGRGDTVYVSLPSSTEESARGEFMISVQPIVVRTSTNGSTYEEPTGQPVDTTFMVYQSPVVTLSLNGFGPDVSESQKKLCPNDDEQGITAVVDPKYNFYEYVYTWQGAVAQVQGGNVADVSLPKDQACAGTLLSHTIKATAEIKNVGCPTIATGTYTVDKLVDPTIDCSSLNNKEYTLGDTEKYYSYELQMPVFTAGCDSNPDIKITVVTTPIDPTVESTTIDMNIKKNEWESADKIVKIPAGSATITYSVIDACDKIATCNVKITINDNTPPNVDCAELKPDTTTTTIQGSCLATPDDETSFPEIKYPELTDENNVDGSIIVDYMGRLENPASVPVVDGLEEGLKGRELFKKDKDLNDPYVVGTTYILWQFTDASGNSKWCLQSRTVLDDLLPNVTCPTVEENFTVASFPDICGLSVNGFLKQVEAPVAYDVCSGEGVRLEPKIYISESVGDGWSDYEYIDTVRYDEIIFDVNKEYSIVWRYFKAQNSSVYEDCEVNFVVKDESAPSFDCTTLATVYVLANTYKEKDKLPKYLSYASYEDVKHTDKNTYIGTLKDPFDQKIIRFVTQDEVTDNCDTGKIAIKVELYDPSGTLVASSANNTLNSLEDLKKQQYKVGLNEIRYTFTDLSGNSSTCSQNIVVSTGTTPVPSCPDEYITLKVDGACEATFVLKKEDVPTASVPVKSRGLYFVFPSDVISNEADLFSYFPSNAGRADNIGALSNKSPYWLNKGFTHPGAPKEEYHQFDALSMDLLCQVTSFEYWDYYYSGFAYEKDAKGNFKKIHGKPGEGDLKLNNWKAWSDLEGDMIGVSNSMSLSDEYTIYPYKVELLNADGTPVSSDAIIAKDDEYGTPDGTFVAGDVENVRYRYFRPRAFHPWDLNGNGEKTDKYDYVCEAKSLNRVNNYADEVARMKLRKGEYQLIYHFENQRNKNAEDYESVACTVKVVVKDTIPPTLACDVIEEAVTKKTYEADVNCEVIMDSLKKYGFREFTATDLSVADNCSDPANLKLYIERVHNGQTNKEATTFYNVPLEMGLTTFRWILEDESLNRDTCELVINVVDKSGPVVDCSKITPITAYTSPTACVALVDSVISAGLVRPEVDDDACSPTGGKIVAEGVRSDNGKDPFSSDPYPLGQTTITWSFTDAAGNVTTCTQIVNVLDTISPTFADCDKMENLVYELGATECGASKEDVLVLLGSHEAKDVCSTTPIVGVPKVDNFGTLESLPDLFERNKTYTIAWVFTDDAGNETICYQSLEIKDVTPPIADGICPEPAKTVEASTECSVSFSDLDLPNPTLEDVCDGTLIPMLVGKITQNDGRVNDYIDGELATVKYPVGEHTFLWIYSDAAGNKDTCTMLLTVVDKIKPVLEDCEVAKDVTVTVSDFVCEITPEDLASMIVHPKAYDECDDLKGDGGKNYIDPTITRWFDEDEDGVFELVVDKNTGEPIVWDAVNFPKGTTIIRWVFEDNAGNEVFCEKRVIVEDHTPPSFDCAKIDPDTLRPEAPTCSYEFGDLKRDVLDKLSYKAYDACAGDSIPGFLTTDGINAIPDNYELHAGVIYKLIWVFADRDGNQTTCDQWILPTHQLPLDVKCEEILSDTIKILAGKGTCTAPQSAVVGSIKIPVVSDPCGLGEVSGVPFDADSVTKINIETHEFKTGNTTLLWRFVSPWNSNDTVWCSQVISVLGNKQFEFDCDTVAPTYFDTIVGCGPVSLTELSLKTPQVPDPCLNEGDPEYYRVGVGTLLDGSPMPVEFPIGNTKIKWTFTDFTGNVDTFCIQDIEIRTKENIVLHCDEITDVQVDVEEGQCTVDANKVKLPTPQYAEHPCLKDAEGNPLKILGVPSLEKGKPLPESYYVGKTLIVWTFADTTNTLVSPVDTCHSYVQVGDVNELPVDCENFPDTLVVLPDEQCELSWTDFNFEVKPVVDLCSKDIVNPVVTIKSTGKVIEYKTYFVMDNGDKKESLELDEVAKDTIVELLTDDIKFGLGSDTIVWDYGFGACEQRITVKNKVAPSGGCESVPDELTISAPSGVCEIPSSVLMDSLYAILDPWPVAYDHCDVEKKNPILGKVYYNEYEITYDSKFNMPVGENTVTWVFIDTAINIVGDTCEKKIIIKSDKEPIFVCDSLDTLSFKTDDCEFTYEWTDENTPKAADACTGDSILGTGTRSDGKDLNAPYPVGKTVITWKFISPYSTATKSCEQIVWVRTTALPKFDCEALDDTVRLTTPEGVCEIAAFSYWEDVAAPVAEDSCTGIKITGVPLTKDSVAYSETDKFIVGDTTKIIWKFFNDSLNVNAKYCDQYVLVTGSNAPLFNCDTLQGRNTKFEIAGCDTILGPDAISTPVAIDFCTKDSVWGVGVRSDGDELTDPFPVGTTVITWTFKSPYSNVPVVCDQDVVVLTSQELDFDCSSLDTILVPVDDITICDVMNLELDGQFANHPCPDQSRVTRIPGVPFVNGNTKITPNADSTKWTIEKIHVGKHTITWTFTDPSDPATMTNPVKECEQVLQVGEGTNASVDCENFPDKTFRLSPDDCAISWSEMNLNIQPVKDLCADTLLIPVVYRTSGKAISAVLSSDSSAMIITADDFTVGVDTIKWEFESISAECEQIIIVKDSMAPEFDCDNFEPNHLTLSAPSGECELVASAIYDSLAAMFEPWPSAEEKCTGAMIPGRVFIDDANLPANEIMKGSSLNISVGSHKLVWVFIDTLINEIGDTCVKDFTLMSDIAPTFECSDLTDIKFSIEGCNTDELTNADIPTPVATDACVKDEEVPAVGVRLNPDGSVQVDASGDTLSVWGVYPVGTTTIRWTFVSPFSNVEKVCLQNVVVLSTQELDFDCEVLADEVLRIYLDPATNLSNPEAETSKLDTLHANHPCPEESGVGFVMGVPSIEGKEKFTLSADSLKWTIPALPADTYTIVWTFADTTGTLLEPTKICTQSLIVEDVIDTLTCPPGRNLTTVACESELPDLIKTFDEFINAGGSITDHNAFDKNSFGYKEFSTGERYCDEMRRVMYYVLDVRKDTVACTDTFFVKDTIAPAFVSDLKPIVITCDQDVPELLKPTVDDCDPDVIITSEKSSTQGDDPSKCDYYSYTVSYKWVAKDRCGNVTDTTQIIEVVDTIAPKVTLPSDWADTVLSVYEKGCVFRVPDFTEDLRNEDVIRDNCTPIGSVIITQTPQGGDTIYQTTKILITISDPCGSDTVVEKWVYAPLREAVVELTSTDTVSCVSDDAPISLMDLSLRYAVGSYKEFDDWTGEYYEKSSSFQWDIYRGKVHKDSLVYSNNKYTHAGEFKHLSSDEAKKLYQLTRQKNSGTYWFVAADTATMCTDTSSSVITLKERPRVSVTTGVEEVCENTLMDSAKIYTYFDCVADMGAPIIKEGWMYGDSLYNFSNSKFVLLENSASFIYYAENECGASTSMDSYKYFCGLDSLTKEDSIFFVGPDDYPALKEDKLVVDGHVTINVHQRFDPLGITITTEPHDPARIWLGELVELQAHTNYKFAELKWYRVVGEYDRRNVVQGENQFEFEFDDSEDEQDIELGSMSLSDSWIITDTPEDTARYYVTISDMVCPSVASELTQVNVILKIPTAFTPYEIDGYNDIFMERHALTIFDRYGQKVFEGDNGWNGTKGGKLADPGVYFYVVTMTDGSQRKGTIEVVYLND